TKGLSDINDEAMEDTVNFLSVNSTVVRYVSSFNTEAVKDSVSKNKKLSQLLSLMSKQERVYSFLKKYLKLLECSLINISQGILYYLGRKIKRNKENNLSAKGKNAVFSCRILGWWKCVKEIKKFYAWNSFVKLTISDIHVILALIKKSGLIRAAPELIERKGITGILRAADFVNSVLELFTNRDSELAKTFQKKVKIEAGTIGLRFVLKKNIFSKPEILELPECISIQEAYFRIRYFVKEKQKVGINTDNHYSTFFYRPSLRNKIFDLLFNFKTGKGIIVDLILNKKESYRKAIRIWSVGASTGAELRTMVWLVKQAFAAAHEDPSGWRLEFYGTDNNKDVLSVAESFKGPDMKLNEDTGKMEPVDVDFSYTDVNYLILDHLRLEELDYWAMWHHNAFGFDIVIQINTPSEIECQKKVVGLINQGGVHIFANRLYMKSSEDTLELISDSSPSAENKKYINNCLDQYLRNHGKAHLADKLINELKPADTRIIPGSSTPAYRIVKVNEILKTETEGILLDETVVKKEVGGQIYNIYHAGAKGAIPLASITDDYAWVAGKDFKEDGKMKRLFSRFFHIDLPLTESSLRTDIATFVQNKQWAKGFNKSEEKVIWKAIKRTENLLRPYIKDNTSIHEYTKNEDGRLSANYLGGAPGRLFIRSVNIWESWIRPFLVIFISSIASASLFITFLFFVGTSIGMVLKIASVLSLIIIGFIVYFLLSLDYSGKFEKDINNINHLISIKLGLTEQDLFVVAAHEYVHHLVAWGKLNLDEDNGDYRNDAVAFIALCQEYGIVEPNDKNLFRIYSLEIDAIKEGEGLVRNGRFDLTEIRQRALQRESESSISKKEPGWSYIFNQMWAGAVLKVIREDSRAGDIYERAIDSVMGTRQKDVGEEK
ncbi:MAG: hypothetical protein NT014_00600, partial [Candidatus Omnitrophica bacterium]|nr:hypothetical protein [Candidatus Omnitrophota bacterium]